MLMFGVDIPLVEIIFAIALIMFILLIETIVLITLLIKQINKTKKLTEVILEIKKRK